MLDSSVKKSDTKCSECKAKDPCGAEDDHTECMKHQHGLDQYRARRYTVGILKPPGISENGKEGRPFTCV